MHLETVKRHTIQFLAALMGLAASMFRIPSPEWGLYPRWLRRKMQRPVPLHRTGLIGSQPAAPEVVAEKSKLRRELGPSPGWLVAPSALWLVVFLVFPLASIMLPPMYLAS